MAAGLWLMIDVSFDYEHDPSDLEDLGEHENQNQRHYLVPVWDWD